MTRTCPVCNGKKEVKVCIPSTVRGQPYPTYTYVTCFTCSGTGKVKDNHV